MWCFIWYLHIFAAESMSRKLLELDSHWTLSKLLFSFAVILDTTKYIYIQNTTVYVLSLELGLSHPLSRQRVSPSPRYQRGGILACGWGVGESQFRRLEKKLSTLPTLCLIQNSGWGTGAHRQPAAAAGLQDHPGRGHNHRQALAHGAPQQRLQNTQVN